MAGLIKRQYEDDVNWENPNSKMLSYVAKTMQQKEPKPAPAPAPTPAPAYDLGMFDFSGLSNLDLSGFSLASPAPAPTPTPAQTAVAAPAPAAQTSGITTPTGSFVPDYAITGGAKSATPAPAPVAAPAPTPAPIQAAAPVTVATTASAPKSQAAPSLSAEQVRNIYANALNRDPDQVGLDYWVEASKNKSADQVYQDILTAAKLTGDGSYVVNNLDFNKAISSSSAQTQNKNTVADEWARNTLGRNLTTQELARWAEKGGNWQTGEELERNYNDFLKEFAGEVENDPGYLAAMRYTTLKEPVTQSAPTSGGRNIDKPVGTEYKPNLDQKVDDKTMTIEGRIGNLMATDQYGNYTNPVVRQAANRAMAAFAQRGLLNSSMAMEAAAEAAMSKAIEIAGPDAQTYFKQSNINQDATNQFARDWTQQSYNIQNKAIDQDYTLERMAKEFEYQTSLKGLEQEYAKELRALDNSFKQQGLDKEQSYALRTNYLTSMNNVVGQYQQAVTNIQIQDMSPEAKSALIQQYETVRQNQINLINKSFSSMPGWVAEWTVEWDSIKPVTPADTGSSSGNTASYDVNSPNWGDN